MKFYNETYFECDEDFNDPWTRTPNTILDEKNISAKAIGIYVKIIRFQNSKKHKIYISSLVNQLKDGKASISSGIKELIELGYLTRIQLRNEKGHLVGCKYIVHVKPRRNENNVNSNYDKPIKNTTLQPIENDENMEDYEDNVNNENGYDTPIENTTFQPKSDFPLSDKPLSDNSSHKKKISKKENKKKENKDVGDDSEGNFELYLKGKKADEKLIKEDMIIELYKTYKIQSRVMPQMKKLLLTYADKIDLELYEEIFMLASEDNVKSKYKYIQDLLVKFDTKGIYTLEAYKLDCEEFKNKKKTSTSNNKSKDYKGQNTGSKPIHTRHHDVESRIADMPKDEVDETLAINQYVKHNNNRYIRLVYEKAMKHGLKSLSNDNIRKSIINYAIFENLEVPK